MFHRYGPGGRRLFCPTGRYEAPVSRDEMSALAALPCGRGVASDLDPGQRTEALSVEVDTPELTRSEVRPLGPSDFDLSLFG
jgi:hypothetical protein